MDRINKEVVVKVLQKTEIKNYFLTMAVESAGSRIEVFAVKIKSDIEKYKRIFKEPAAH